MALKLMYITNNPAVARIAEEAGVDRIFVDMEYIGKADRQGGMDTVQSHHTTEDVRNIRKTVRKADIIVRINPIHEASGEYGSSREEIDEVIRAGADLIMLPYFKTMEEIKRFLSYIDHRVKSVLLLETPEAAELVDEILESGGIDEIYIGLNDLSLGYGKQFMFELLADGTVEKLCVKFKLNVIKEHYRLGSTCVILSRSFCNTEKITDLEEIRRIFQNGVQAIREQEKECEAYASYFGSNKHRVVEIVKLIGEKKKAGSKE